MLTVKQLIQQLLNAKLDDEVKLYDQELNIFHKINLIDLIPSARGMNQIHIEFSSSDRVD